VLGTVVKLAIDLEVALMQRSNLGQNWPHSLNASRKSGRATTSALFMQERCGP
jgi:hypothetical protein